MTTTHNYVNLKNNRLIITKTPLPGYTLKNIFNLLKQTKFSIHIPYLPRLLYSLGLSTFMAPFRTYEHLKYDKKIHQTTIQNDPIFIIGFWRSGTTYMQNLLSLDQSLSSPTTFQAYLPTVFLSYERLFKPIVAGSLPKKRPMDDVAMSAEFPQEDSYALGAFSPYSYYHGWCFPTQMEYYNNLIILDNHSKHHQEQWKNNYLYVLKKITYASQGKQLVLKNQDNTARIHLLLELFPNAKFICMQRNPYDLYASMMKFMKIVIPLYCIQTPPPLKQVEQSMMTLYTNMFTKYLQQKKFIPQNNLIEIKYEQFTTKPLQTLNQIYNKLQLNGFTQAEKQFLAYINIQKHIKTSNYKLDKTTKQKIQEQWNFSFKAFNYKT